MMTFKTLQTGLSNGKCCLILDVTKEAQEVMFSHKSNKTDHPVVYFNEAPVAKASIQKQLGMHLDEIKFQYSY